MWWTGKALGFDFETDGRDPLDARIITCGMVAMDPGLNPTGLELMLQPERDIDPGAVAIHGITTERATAEGTLREMGIRQIALTVAEIVGEDAPMVGHNLSYDLTVLDREMRRVGAGSLNTDVDTGFVSLRMDGKQVTRFPVIDTLVLDKAIDRYRPGKRQLSFVAAHYGVPMAEDSAHGATADVITSLRIAITIANRCRMANGDGPNGYDMDLCNQVMAIYANRKRPNEIARTLCHVGQLSIKELHDFQRRAAMEQAEGLREHFMQNPDKGNAATVSGAWPLHPVPAVETVTTELI